jgi:hypothetical protein
LASLWHGRHVESSISIAWHRMKHVFGWPARWSEPLQANWFKTLQTLWAVIT